jgi:hypothetical protein
VACDGHPGALDFVTLDTGCGRRAGGLSRPRLTGFHIRPRAVSHRA